MNDHVKANARMMYESQLRAMSAATGQARDFHYFQLQGFINGMYWSDLITDEEYFDLDEEAFNIWTRADGREK